MSGFVLSFPYAGIPLTHQKIVPGNTATGLSAYCYKYSLWRLNFDDADSEIVIGDWVRGTTGSEAAACGKVRYVTSTAWTDGVGYLLIDSWNGVAWTNDDEIIVAAGATMANVNQAAAIVEATDAEYNLCGMLPYKGKVAKSASIVVYANTALVEINGGKPDQTALIGIPLQNGMGIDLNDANCMSNFYCIDYTASSASILQVEFSF